MISDLNASVGNINTTLIDCLKPSYIGGWGESTSGTFDFTDIPKGVHLILAVPESDTAISAFGLIKKSRNTNTLYILWQKGSEMTIVNNKLNISMQAYYGRVYAYCMLRY